MSLNRTYQNKKDYRITISNCLIQDCIVAANEICEVLNLKGLCHSGFFLTQSRASFGEYKINLLIWSTKNRDRALRVSRLFGTIFAGSQ